jgi:hypothetical protein
MPGGWSSGVNGGHFSSEQEGIAKWALSEMAAAPGFPTSRRLEFVRLLNVSSQVVAG